MAASASDGDEAEDAGSAREPAAGEPRAARQRRAEGDQTRARRRDDQSEGHHNAGHPDPRGAGAEPLERCDQLRRRAGRWPSATEPGGHVPRRQRTRHQHPCREVIAVHERAEWPGAGVERPPSPVNQRWVAARLQHDGHECRDQARERDMTDDSLRHAERAGPSRRPEHHECADHEPDAYAVDAGDTEIGCHAAASGGPRYRAERIESA